MSSSNQKTSSSVAFERLAMEAYGEKKKAEAAGGGVGVGVGGGGSEKGSAKAGEGSEKGGSGSGSSTSEKKLRALFDKLGENDEKFFTIDFCKQRNLFAYCWADDELFGELLGILRTNSVVTKVDIDPTLLRRLPREQTSVLFEAVGALENLEELNFTSLTGQSVLEIDLLSVALSRCTTTLQSLRLHSIKPHGSEEDLDDFISAIQGCKALNKFEFFVTSTANINLDTFVRAINGCPAIEEIRMISNLRRRQAWISAETIAEYCKSPTLKKLTLRNQRMTKDHMPVICDALKTNPVLEYLDFDGNNLGDEGVCLLANEVLAAAPDNKSNLIELDISENWFGDTGCIAISNALITNKSLSFLNVQQNNNNTKPSLDSIVEMLSYNFYLEELEIDQEFDDEKDGEEVEDLEIYNNIIEFYLHLNNEANRGGLLELKREISGYKIVVKAESTPDQWIDAIENVSDDLSCLYYLLRINPCLCG